MSDAKPPADVVERAAAAVRGAAVPDPPAEVMAATFAAVRTQVAAARRARRRRRIMRNVTVCGFVLTALGVAVGLLGGGGSAQASLLKALKKHEKAESYRAVMTVTLAGAPAGTPPLLEQKLYFQGDKMRTESGDEVSVFDEKQVVTLNAKTKVATTLDLDDDAAVLPKGVAEGIKEVVDAMEGKGKVKVTPVAAVSIGGKMRPGYKVAGGKLADGMTGDGTYWLDEEKDLLLRYELVTNKPAAVTVTFDYFGFDEKLDAKLFDMTIPADYKRVKAKR